MNVVNLNPPASAKDLRPLVDAWDELSNAFNLNRRQAFALVETATLAIARRTGRMVFVECQDELLGGTGAWEAVSEKGQRNAMLDLECTDYAGGMDSRRDAALGVRVTREHYEMIVRAARELFEPLPDNSTTVLQTVERYPDELRAAFEAFEAVRNNAEALRGVTPKTALLAWLSEHKPELSNGARERIATVANWQPGGGAPRTLG